MQGGRGAPLVFLTWCLFVLCGNFDGSGASVVSGAVPLEDPLMQDGGSGEAKRMVKREVRPEKCSEVEVQTNKTFQPIKRVKQHHYTFFMKPQPTFRAIKFNILIDNTWDWAEAYNSKETIVFTRSDMEEQAQHQEWVEFLVDYYKHEVNNGRDKLGLRVTLRNMTRQLISSRWWRTHRYEGFVVSARGPATLLFDCPPQSPAAPVPARLLNTPALLGGMLALAFLLVVVPWACVLQRKHSKKLAAESPEVPPLPKSLQLIEKDKVSKCPDHDNVYEEFDEDTLSRLRQKLSPKTLRGEAEDPAPDHHYEKLRPQPLQRQQAMDKQQAAPENYYENAPSGMSLREEKAKIKKEDRQRSLSESHYVEMHGILNRHSFDFSK